MGTNPFDQYRRAATRREWLAFACLLTACGNPAAPPERLLPPAIGGWERQQIQQSEYAQGADPLAVSGVRRVLATAYGGPGTIHVRLYEMSSQAGGLDAIQRWRPAPDTVTFHHNQYFAAVRWEDVDRAKLTDFVRALESHIRQQ
jgi:hypothetical protein